MGRTNAPTPGHIREGHIREGHIYRSINSPALWVLVLSVAPPPAGGRHHHHLLEVTGLTNMSWYAPSTDVSVRLPIAPDMWELVV